MVELWKRSIEPRRLLATGCEQHPKPSGPGREASGKDRVRVGRAVEIRWLRQQADIVPRSHKRQTRRPCGASQICAFRQADGLVQHSCQKSGPQGRACVTDDRKKPFRAHADRALRRDTGCALQSHRLHRHIAKGSRRDTGMQPLDPAARFGAVQGRSDTVEARQETGASAWPPLPPAPRPFGEASPLAALSTARPIQGRLWLTSRLGPKDRYPAQLYLRLKLQVQHLGPLGHRMLRWTDQASTSAARNAA